MLGIAYAINRLKYVLLALFIGLPAVVEAVAPDDLLDPQQAFVLTASGRDAGTLVASWTIADGYYLYRNRFRFESATPGIRLGEPRFPTGQIKEDEYFGRMETYHHRVDVEIPLIRDTSAPAQLDLKTVAQGCADIGVCYPPQTQTVTVRLPPPQEKPAANLGGGQSQSGAALNLVQSTPSPTLNLAANKPEASPTQAGLLEPEAAFILSVTAPDPHTLVARWTIADGYYLYRDKLKLTLVDADGLRVSSMDVPHGDGKEDEFFGHQEVFHRVAAVTAHLQGDAGRREINVRVAYQGCAEDLGVCYPPMSQLLPVTLPALNAVPRGVVAAAASVPPVAEAEQDYMARMLTERRFWATPAFFGFGLLLAFTPCVFPMIPILSSLIAGQGEQLTSRRAFLLSLTYVLAMTVAYTVAGVLAALLGQNIQAWFQNAWILIGFSGLFVALALSMFGFYDLQVPTSWQSRLTTFSNRQRSGSYVGVAVMGLLSALIVGPCVAPPLIAVLTVIATTGDALLGGGALFALGLGMGAPLLLIGTSAGRWLPHAGHWMERIKAVFGVLLLAVALWMLDRVLPEVISMLLWAVLLIVTATYMGALQPLTHGVPPWRVLVKGLGVVLLIYGVLLLVGVAAGGRDVLQPLRGVGFVAAEERSAPALAFRPVRTVAELERELDQAGGRPMMLDFYADWCVACKEMDKYTFTAPKVQGLLANAVLLRADVTANDATAQALLRHFDIIGPPAVLFFDSTGVEQRPYRVFGFMAAERFATHLERALRLETAAKLE